MSSPATVLANRLLLRARLRHLQVFVRTVELGSVRRVAEHVGLTQPAASHILADLEQLVEAPLFRRHARGMTPMPLALALLPHVRRILAEVDACADVTAALAGQASQVVRLAAIAGAVAGLLAEALPAFMRAQPDILVRLQEASIEEIDAQIARGEVDLALCRQPAALPQEWHFLPLLDDRLIVVAGPQHPLAAAPSMTLDTLWQETWLLGDVASAPRRALEALSVAAGVEPQLRLLNTRSMALLWSMLRQEAVLALVPASTVRQLLAAEQLVQLPVVIPVPLPTLGLLLPETGLGTAAATLAQFLQRWPRRA